MGTLEPIGSHSGGVEGFLRGVGVEGRKVGKVLRRRRGPKEVDLDPFIYSGQEGEAFGIFKDWSKLQIG